MSMKLSKKDIIMLIVLGIVMFVAVFYVYGIMPANEKSAELDANIATKQQQVQDMMNKLTGLNVAEVDKKIDDLLDYYYANNKEATIHEVLDREELEKMLIPVLRTYGMQGYIPSSWNVLDSGIIAKYDEVEVMIPIKIASIPLTVKFKETAEFYRFIRDMRDNKDFRITQFSFTEEKEEEGAGEISPTDPAPTDPEAKPEEKFECSVNMLVEFYMGEKYTSATLPTKMPDVTNLTIKEGTTDTLVFDKVEGATGYEVCLVEVVDGKVNMTKIDNARPSEVAGKMQVTLYKDQLGELNEATIAIRAVGDRKTTFKTILTTTSPIVSVAFE